MAAEVLPLRRKAQNKQSINNHHQECTDNKFLCFSYSLKLSRQEFSIVSAEFHSILNNTVFNLYMPVLILPEEKMEQVAFEKCF